MKEINWTTYNNLNQLHKQIRVKDYCLNYYPTTGNWNYRDKSYTDSYNDLVEIISLLQTHESYLHDEIINRYRAAGSTYNDLFEDC